MDLKNQKNNVLLFCASSANAPDLAAEQVGLVKLVVTSPPYHNAISYTSHAEDSNLNYRERTHLDYGRDYLPMLSRVWDSCWEMLTPGGVIAVNVGSVLDHGYHYPLTLDISETFTKSDKPWIYIKTILWHKVTAGVKRAGSVIQHPFPGYWYPNIMTEHILIFQKPGGAIELNSSAPSGWLESIWDIAPVPPRKVNHPAPFPEEIPHRLIALLTQEGDLVMDPFNGAGATTKAAFDLGRDSIGFDIEQKYIDIARERIQLPSSVRGQQLAMSLISRADFTPGKSQGKTRHGAGLASVRGAAK